MALSYRPVAPFLGVTPLRLLAQVLYVAASSNLLFSDQVHLSVANCLASECLREVEVTFTLPSHNRF
jgi:hypothetical protein